MDSELEQLPYIPDWELYADGSSIMLKIANSEEAITISPASALMLAGCLMRAVSEYMEANHKSVALVDNCDLETTRVQ